MTGPADGPAVVVRISGLGQPSDGAFSARLSFGDAAEYEQIDQAPNPADSGTGEDHDPDG
jgi:hypothetical protein